jgi:thymidylate synthase (FAD)
MLPERLQRFATPTEVLDDGHVMLIDVMGDDAAVVQAARVSYGEGTRTVNDDRGLIRYLLRNGHTTPFEMCEIKLRIRVPMDTWRQWIRHRTANVNEYSTRYSEAIDSMQTTKPALWRLQAQKNKQGSAGYLRDWPEGYTPTPEVSARCGPNPGVYLSDREAEVQKMARAVYRERLNLGVAREQARKDLPLSTYTEAYWKCDLHNLMHFLTLRGERDDHAQEEIRLYSHCIAEIVKAWVPLTWEAFNDYRLKSMHFSRQELEGLKALLQGTVSLDSALDASGLVKRERQEFEEKLRLLMA